MRRFLVVTGPAAGLCGSFLLMFFQASGADEPWVQIFDQQAVTFSQIDPNTPHSPASDWEVGFISVNFQQLARDGFTTGYIQVVEYDPGKPSSPGAWVVQNFPIDNPNLSPAEGELFPIAAPTTGPLASTYVGVFHTFAAAQPSRGNGGKGGGGVNGGPAPAMPKGGNPVRPVFNPINRVTWAIGGATIPPPARVPNTIDPIYGDPSKQKNVVPPPNMATVGPLWMGDSMPQLLNQCAPASVANSMDYLRVNDGLTNAPSGQANSRVAALDMPQFMNRAAGQGLPMYNMLVGKVNYINAKKLDKTLVMKHQGHFCFGNQQPCVNGNADYPPGKQVKGIQSMGNGAPSAMFLTDELAAGEDVEVCFAWATGAHCVMVTGYDTTNGYLVLKAVQDANQGGMGGTAGAPGHPDLEVGNGPGGSLWIRDWPFGPARITNVISESPAGQ